MAQQARLDVQLIASTSFTPPPDISWDNDAATPGEGLIEFAGRACYETFHKPNPHTATNGSYLRHIMEVGHLALLEHASATMYVRGVSRMAAQEIMRHRHFSFSQLSQRYVPEYESDIVMADPVAEDPQTRDLMRRAADDAYANYQELLALLEQKLIEDPGALLVAKQLRQAARGILPGAMETRFVMTGNYRAWRHFIAMHGAEQADMEVRRVAVECATILRGVAPVVFDDFEVSTLPDGTRMVTSPYVTDY